MSVTDYLVDPTGEPRAGAHTMNSLKVLPPYRILTPCDAGTRVPPSAIDQEARPFAVKRDPVHTFDGSRIPWSPTRSPSQCTIASLRKTCASTGSLLDATIDELDHNTIRDIGCQSQTYRGEYDHPEIHARRFQEVAAPGNRRVRRALRAESNRLPFFPMTIPSTRGAGWR